VTALAGCWPRVSLSQGAAWLSPLGIGITVPPGMGQEYKVARWPARQCNFEANLHQQSRVAQIA